MTGHIRKRGDAWELRVYVGVDAVTEKKRYATKSIRGGKRDAERALVELAAVGVERRSIHHGEPLAHGLPVVVILTHARRPLPRVARCRAWGII